MAITSETTATILYTAALAGRIDILPTLFNRIQQEKSRAQGFSVLVDLGCSCAAEAWICESTHGIGMLVAMDAMGYDAFHIGPADPLYTQPGPVQHLRGTILTPLAAGPWTATIHRADVGVTFASQPGQPAPDIDLVVVPGLTGTARVETGWSEQPGPYRTLVLDPGRIEPLLGRLDIALLPDPPYSRILGQEEIRLPEGLLGTLPNPTIVSVIEFVQSEARYAERKRAGRGYSS